MMRTNNHITDLDAIELSSAWNYNSKLSIGQDPAIRYFQEILKY